VWCVCVVCLIGAWTVMEWPVVNGGSPQQTNSYDCGVFMCMQIAAMMQEVDPCLLRQAHMYKSRTRMLLDILQHSASFGYDQMSCKEDCCAERRHK
jgi:hypothetical protein